MKKNFDEIEATIESRIAELEEEYELDKYDIADIRLEAYREGGWSYDPFPLEDEEEEDEEEEDEEEEETFRCWTMTDMLREVGMSMRDFY